MHTELVTLVKREDLNEAIRLQYDLDNTYDCWTALFDSTIDDEAIASFGYFTDLSNILKATVDECPTGELQSVHTLQYLVDCGYDRILIEY